MAMAFRANSMMAMIIIGLIRLCVWQLPERIGTCGVWRDIPGFRSHRNIPDEIESGKAAEELAEFLPGILAPVDNDFGCAVAFVDPTVYSGSFDVESVLTGHCVWEIDAGRASKFVKDGRRGCTAYLS